MSKIKVLIVDDAALMRKLLTEILSSSPKIEVVGTAADPFIARDKIKQLNPDVITLDVEMPRMDGVTFLKNLMRLRPIPVVMISTLTEDGADVTLEALESGAIDYIPKPKTDFTHSLSDYADDIIEKVIIASTVNVSKIEKRIKTFENMKVSPKLSADAILAGGSAQTIVNTTDKFIAIGASTGGTEAIKEVIMALPSDVPGIVIAQHIPATFSTSFARRLDEYSSLRVREARQGDQIISGHVYLAPGDKHLIIKRTGAKYICELNDGPEVNRHKPSVDVLFRSVAKSAGPNVMGVMLTGMGADGAQGMLEMKQAGAYNIAQDEKTSVVWGMPGAAVKLGAVDKELPLDGVAKEIMKFARKSSVS
ncbi:MAG: chemotaxis response regulator protein-glutamate methylesterase [Gammaproteobacteria bacterium]|nr:chemotaxis response regulator protein-glutamate methylesterase [Gammaproteobacteria bacterium]